MRMRPWMTCVGVGYMEERGWRALIFSPRLHVGEYQVLRTVFPTAHSHLIGAYCAHLFHCILFVSR